MTSLIQTVEKELHVSRSIVIEEGIKHFLSAELRNISIEIKKQADRHQVNSFEQLWRKLEDGEITEGECFDDLSRLEFLELEKEKITKLLAMVD